jgi:hypothetical protein
VTDTKEEDPRDAGTNLLDVPGKDSAPLRPVCLFCNWCKRRGHGEESCFRKLGLCLICGGKHKMEACVKFVAKRRSLSLSCPTCSGNHLGKRCPLKRDIKFCNWCGKCGHSEDNCWLRYQCCLICGSPDQLLKCSRFMSRWPLTFPPWCVECGSQHLGRDCECPYQE